MFKYGLYGVALRMGLKCCTSSIYGGILRLIKTENMIVILWYILRQFRKVFKVFWRTKVMYRQE